MNTTRLKATYFLTLNYCRNSCSGNFQRQIACNNSLKVDNDASSNFDCNQISHRHYYKVFQPQIVHKPPGCNLLCTVLCSKCWSCSCAFNKWERFCPDCNRIQAINSSLNYFDVLGIDQEFSIDVSNLSKKFRALQAVYHPDKFSLKSKEEQELSAECSSSLNKAYRTLQHPMTRAEYLLRLAGRTLQEEVMILDQDFLMSIMELNEELSEAEGKEAVQELGRKNKQTLDALLREADEAFQQSDMDRARDVVARLKYYENIYNKVREYEREHGIVD